MQIRFFAYLMIFISLFTIPFSLAAEDGKKAPIYRILIFVDTGDSMREGNEVMKIAGAELPSWMSLLIKGNADYRPLPDKFTLNIDAYCTKNGNQIITEQRYTHTDPPVFKPLLDFEKIMFWSDNESRNELLFKRQINPQNPACRDTVFLVLSNSVHEPKVGSVLKAEFEKANSVFIYVKLPRSGAYRDRQSLQKVINNQIAIAFAKLRDSIPGLKRKIELNLLPVSLEKFKESGNTLNMTAVIINGLKRQTGPIRYKIESIKGAELANKGPALNSGELLRGLKGGAAARLSIPVKFASISGPDLKLKILFTIDMDGGDVQFTRELSIKDIVPRQVEKTSYACRWNRKSIYSLSELPPGAGVKTFALPNVFKIHKLDGKGAVRLKVTGCAPDNYFDSITLGNTKKATWDFDSAQDVSLHIKLSKLPINQDCVIQLAAGGVNDAKVLLDKSIYEIKLIGLPPQKLRFLSNQITVSDENKPIVVPINMLDVKYPVELLAYYTEKGKKISGVITVKPGESRPVLPWKTSSLMPLPDKIVIAAPAGESTLIPYRGNTKAELVELSTKDMRGPAPVADFTCSSFSGSAPFKVSFINRSKNADKYIWDFGNGQTSTEESPSPVTYRIASQKPYTITLTAISGSRRSVKRTTVVVNSSPLPIASFSYSPIKDKAPVSVQFINKSKNFDSCRWEFGKGASPDSSSSVDPPKVKYTKPGNYTVKLTIFTNEGASESLTKTVEIKGSSMAPVIILGIIIAAAVAALAWLFLRPRVKLEVCFYRDGREVGVKPLKGTLSLARAFGCNRNIRIYSLFDKEIDDWQFQMTSLGDDAEVEFVRDGSKIKVTENIKTVSLRLGRYAVVGTEDEFEVREPED